jgi:hypothetical protein
MGGGGELETIEEKFVRIREVLFTVAPNDRRKYFTITEN